MDKLLLSSLSVVSEFRLMFCGMRRRTPYPAPPISSRIQISRFMSPILLLALASLMIRTSVRKPLKPFGTSLKRETAN